MFEGNLVYSVYVLKSKKDNKRYIGITNNLERRIRQHNKGGVTSTKYRIPFKLEYKEEYLDRLTAHKRERYFKTSAGRRFLSKIDAEMVELADTYV